jgi:hypothetical protein
MGESKTKTQALIGMVKIFDHPTRFYVKSGSDSGKAYVVDIAQLPDEEGQFMHGLEYNGVCDCENFKIRLAPLLKNGKHVSNDTRCKHIVSATYWAGLHYARIMSYVEEMAQEHPKEWGPTWNVLRMLFTKGPDSLNISTKEQNDERNRY